MNKLWTILDVLNWTVKRFEDEKIPSARLDAELLLAHVLGIDRIRLYVDYGKPLAEAERIAYRQSVKRRLAGEPVAYIVEEKEFWSIPLYVKDVLIPRPDTETLVEEALKWVKKGPFEAAIDIVDVGTGSGAIALALKKELNHATIKALDVDDHALDIAQKNAERNQLEVECLKSDLLSACEPNSADLIVSNPPYIPRAEIEELAIEIKNYEPRKALDGGKDGLDLIRILIKQAKEVLRPGGALFFELASPQMEAAKALCRDAGFEQVEGYNDLAGSPRVVFAS